MKKKILHIIAIALLALVAVPVSAQSTPYKFDFGGGVGMSGYLGDANASNLFSHPGYDVEITARYLPNSRFAVRGVFSALSLSGNTADMHTALPEGTAYSFSANVFDLGVRGEFNFFAYGIGETYKSLKRWTPYLTVGVGVCLSSCGGSTTVAPTLPMGIGVKYKIKERLNLGVEFTMTKAFSDRIDGSDLHDLNGIKTSFVKNTDWFSRISVGITYEFGKRCETCHYVE